MLPFYVKTGISGYVNIFLKMPKISLEDLIRNLSSGCCFQNSFTSFISLLHPKEQHFQVFFLIAPNENLIPQIYDMFIYLFHAYLCFIHKPRLFWPPPGTDFHPFEDWCSQGVPRVLGIEVGRRLFTDCPLNYQHFESCKYILKYGCLLQVPLVSNQAVLVSFPLSLAVLI